MKKIVDKFGGILTVIGEFGVGVALFIKPDGFTEMIITVMGVLLAAMGIIQIIGYFRMEPEIGAESMTLTVGMLAIICGFFCVFQARWFIITFPLLTVIYGVIMLALGVRKLASTVDLLRLHNKKWQWKCLSGVITTLGAVIILCNPFNATKTLWVFVASALVVEGFMDTIALVSGATRHSSKRSDDDYPADNNKR